MRIAILYICTGRYNIFWDDFFASCEKFFLPLHERHYFVFTDDASMHSHQRVHKIEQHHLGWPYDTLKRYHMFSQIKHELLSFDFVFFFNANCLFLKKINEEILPSLQEGLVVTQHPGFYNKSSDEFTYDRNPESSAYIPYGTGKVYVCGGVNGGHSTDFCSLITELSMKVDKNEKNKIIALWHDESHLNHYILDKNYKLLSPAYCYPEKWKLPFEEIVRIRDKTLLGGHKFLRKQDFLSQLFFLCSFSNLKKSI